VSTTPFDPEKFAEDTEFERFVMDRLGTHRVRPPEPGSVHDTRGGGPGSITVRIGSVVAGASLVEEFRRSLHALGFSAAYKVLDMLIEHVLRASGASAGRLRFADKRRAVQRRPSTLPVPLNSHTGVWDRLAALYIAFEPARHAVTHRRATTNANGDLEIYDGQRRLIDTIASDEIGAFAAAAHTVAELVIDSSADWRRAAIAASYLNTLDARHRLGAIPAPGPEVPRRLLIMDLDRLEDGALSFDVAAARTVVEGQTASYWDLELHAGGAVFTGRWEEVPARLADVIDFDPATPPAWLTEQIPPP